MSTCCRGQDKECSKTGNNEDHQNESSLVAELQEWTIAKSDGPTKKAPKTTSTLTSSAIPDWILKSEPLNEAIDRLLPKNYNFEIHKSIYTIRRFQSRRVALQMPEGLQMFATAICTILQEFSYSLSPPSSSSESLNENDIIAVTDGPIELDTVILGDVTYGACCIDDFTARALKCDLLIHYGHSCLIPVTTTQIKTLYVFVDIRFNLQHLLDTIVLNFDKGMRLAILGTIQFVGSLQALVEMLKERGFGSVSVPQVKPLSPGEVLGCTSPRLSGGEEAVLYLGDGRFHLESIMIANPHLRQAFYRYDPYTASITREFYEHDEMLNTRKESVEQARLSIHSDKPESRWAVVLGTLGRQGSPAVLENIRKRILPDHNNLNDKSSSNEDLKGSRSRRCMTVLLSELSPQKLALFNAKNPSSIDVWVQTSCPRLSIDWSTAFDRPLLTTYEAMLATLPEDEYERMKPAWMKNETRTESREYPMDFYANESLGPWTPNHVDAEEVKRKKEERRKIFRERMAELRNKKPIS